MEGLIPVDYTGEQPRVSARLLHSFLEVDTGFRHWFPRMCGYGFTEGPDYTPVIFEHPQNKQPTTDYDITIQMAKEISMIQRNEKGKLARQYFLAVEKAWNTPEMIMSRALKLAEANMLSLKRINAELADENKSLRPKAEMHDMFLSAENVQSISVVAKSLGTGPNKLFRFLREKKILLPNNTPYQEYLDRHYFKVVEKPIAMGAKTVNKPQTLVTARGADYIAKLLKEAR